MAQDGTGSMDGGFDFFFCGVQQPGVSAGNAADGFRRGCEIHVSQDLVDQRSKACALGARSGTLDTFDLNTIGIAGWRLDTIGCKDYFEARGSTAVQQLLARRFPAVIRLRTLNGMTILVLGQDFFLPQAKAGLNLKPEK